MHFRSVPIFLSLSLLLQAPVNAARFTPVGLCALTSDNGWESITPPPGIGGEYPSGTVQSISTVVADTQQPGGSQAATGDTENVLILLDDDNDGTPTSLGNGSCTYDQLVPGCLVNQNVTIPSVTEDTTFRGRVMLSYNDLTPANGCGSNGYGDSRDSLIVANVLETITISDVSSPEDGGAILVTATLSHDVRDGSGFVPFTVDYATADGTATLANADYTSASGTFTFNGQAGDAQSFIITPTSDIVPEGAETIIVSLSNLSNTTHGIDISDTATVTLLEDDTEVDLVMSKQADDYSPNIGATVVFTLQVDNSGPDAVVGASVQDVVPAGFSSISPVSVPPGTTFNISGNTIDWTGINLPVSGSVSATYSALVLAP